MIDDYKNGKIERILGIYTKLLSGNIVNKLKEAQEYGVNERTIQRDIEDIRSYMETEAERTGCINSVVYDRIKKRISAGADLQNETDEQRGSGSL